MLDQLGAPLSSLEFCAVTEHGTADAGQRSASEVALLFDVTLTHPDQLAVSARSPYRWSDQQELSSHTLWPEVVKDRLVHTTFPAGGNPWWPWSG